jgi:uncharacterized protein
VSKLLPTREQAIQLLRDAGCTEQVVSHCVAVTALALEFALKLQKRSCPVDLALVEAGGLLHDIGRSKTHAVEHSLVGAQIAKELGLSDSVVNIIKCHVGAGITAEEAAWLGWPKDTYIPQTLEEKIVTYADKCVDHDKRVPIETEIQKLLKDNHTQAAERVRNLHAEITLLLGNTP